MHLRSLSCSSSTSNRQANGRNCCGYLPTERNAYDLFSLKNKVALVNSNAAEGQTSVVSAGTNLATCPSDKSACIAIAEIDA